MAEMDAVSGAAEGVEGQVTRESCRPYVQPAERLESDTTNFLLTIFTVSFSRSFVRVCVFVLASPQC